MFYRRDGDQIQSAVGVHAPSYTLDEASHDEHSYPVDGWYWFGTMDEALDGLPRTRATQAVLAWQARYILATMPAITDGPLAAAPGVTLLEQIDAFAEQALDAPALEKFKGATTWQRTDAMLLQLSALAGLNDAAIDAWFDAAGQVQ